jgi:hypothetical protein
VLCAWTVGLSVLGCRDAGQNDGEWLIVPGQRIGLVGVATSEQELIRAYGAAAVEQGRVELGEGETAPGTILFGTDSLRRLEVLWHDTVSRARPARVIVRGRTGVWHLPSGIRLGTRLRQLEQYNQGAFTLAGFGWDYGGVVLDWRGGALAARLRGVWLYLDPAPDQRASPAYQAVLGDHDYVSSAEPMQVLDPWIYQILVDFEAPSQQRRRRLRPNPRMPPTGPGGSELRPGAAPLEDAAEHRLVRASMMPRR